MYYCFISNTIQSYRLQNLSSVFLVELKAFDYTLVIKKTYLCICIIIYVLFKIYDSLSKTHKIKIFLKIYKLIVNNQL